MGLFSSNKSTTQQTSNTWITDQSANSAEGGFAAGAGANVQIQTADPEIAARAFVVADSALAGQRDVAGLALAGQQGVSSLALNTSRDVAIAGLETTTALANKAINTVQSMGEVSSRERTDVLTATQYALESQRGLSNKIADLSSAALERSQTPDSQVTKNLIWGVVAIAAALALAAVMFLKKSKA